MTRQKLNITNEALPTIAIIGATGMVGRKFAQVLKERNIRANYIAFASAKSAGKLIEIANQKVRVQELTKENIRAAKCSYALFSAGGVRSKEFAPIFAKTDCIVIDNSSAFRMDKTVPLVVPEVNAQDLKKHKKIIANPNCSTIAAVVPLKALDDKFDIKRIIYSTYQAVSGAGQEGFEDLANGIKGMPPKKFPHPIYNNLIPHIDDFLDDGFNKEEEKMINETRKILHKPALKICATTVRVPVFNSHSISINIECRKPITRGGALAVLKKAKGVVVQDDPSTKLYPMPLNATGHDEVFVGRVREDKSCKNGLAFFAVADNIRKGAATNAVQILEELLKTKK